MTQSSIAQGRSNQSLARRLRSWPPTQPQRTSQAGQHKTDLGKHNSPITNTAHSAKVRITFSLYARNLPKKQRSGALSLSGQNVNALDACVRTTLLATAHDPTRAMSVRKAIRLASMTSTKNGRPPNRATLPP